MLSIRHLDLVVLLVIILGIWNIQSSGEDQTPFNRTESADNFEEVIPPSGKAKDTITEEEISIGDETVRKDEMEDMPEEEERGDIPEDQWMSEALLDVAYYLRAHKFGDFDRRYVREEDATEDDKNLFEKFPEPPLRNFHWEVFKYCSAGLSSCLKYLHGITMDAYLQRTSDAGVLMGVQGWTWAAHNDTILAVDAECKRLRDLDWAQAAPFQGPLERFQWRASASYFMCWYTLQGRTALSFFGEPCDNFADCLDDQARAQNGDWRADDGTAFACARYSFCPDVCCPRRHVRYRTECALSPSAPCWDMEELQTRFCDMSPELNTDLASLIYNRWNVTCRCREPGFVWDSRFGICVDRNECEAGGHACHSPSELCFNTVGGHGCCCRWGYELEAAAGTCTRSAALARLVDRVSRRPRAETPVEAAKPRPEAASVGTILRSIFAFLKSLVT